MSFQSLETFGPIFPNLGKKLKSGMAGSKGWKMDSSRSTAGG
jgi:hypothetical protein